MDDWHEVRPDVSFYPSSLILTAFIYQSFLKNVYTAFNVGAQTVSFGKLKEAR